MTRCGFPDTGSDICKQIEILILKFCKLISYLTDNSFRQAKASPAKLKEKDVLSCTPAEMVSAQVLARWPHKYSLGG